VYCLGAAVTVTPLGDSSVSAEMAPMTRPRMNVVVFLIGKIKALTG
jgi:hypothetical protein